jgi:hypothetical protein
MLVVLYVGSIYNANFSALLCPESHRICDTIADHLDTGMRLSDVHHTICSTFANLHQSSAGTLVRVHTDSSVSKYKRCAQE